MPRGRPSEKGSRSNEIVLFPMFVGGWISLKELTEGTSDKIKDIGFTFLKVKEVMKNLRRKRDVIERKVITTP